MPLLLNGHPVLFDHEGALRKCWDVFAPPDYWTTSQPWWVNDDRSAARSEHRNGRALPRPNWTPIPPPRLNVVYQPCGASRWGHVCVLIDTYEWSTSELDDLYNGELILLELHNGSYHEDWYMACERALRVSGHPEGGNVQLLTLVDERYHAQWKDHTLEVEDGDTWADVIAELVEATLGTSFTIESSFIDARFGEPDATELSRTGNAAQMLDAALWSVGKVLTWRPWTNYFGTVELDSVLQHPDLVMGGRFPVVSMFDSLDIVCRRKIDGVIRPDLEEFVHNVNITTATTRPYYKTDHKGVIKTTMTADDTQSAYDLDPDTPSNESTISDLADALSEVYEELADVGMVDVVLAGAWHVPAILSGETDIALPNWVDFHEYGIAHNVDLPMFAGINPGSTLENHHVIYTHIRTLPPTFGSDFNLCQDGYFVDDHPAEVILFSLNEELTTSDEHVAATVEKYFNGKDPGSTVDVYNTETGVGGTYGMATASGKFGYAYLDKKTNRYYIIHLLC